MSPDPFSLLGLEPRFDLDPGEVQRRYLARAGELHPDVAASDPDAPARAAALNDARAVLADPERRAGALLQRLGGPTPEQDKSLPPDFLGEMMEIREQIDEARSAGDPARLRAWVEWTADRRRSIIGAVSESFRAIGPSPASGALAGLRRQLNAWRYIERLRTQLED